MNIFPRSGWGAANPKGIHRIGPTPRLWLHHTAGPTNQSLQAIQRYHQVNKGWLDIAYSFLVDVNGRAYEGRGARVAGGHTAGDNSTSHAICAIGNFQNMQPPAAMLETIAQLTAHGHRENWWTTETITGGHRQAPGAATACPGNVLQDRIGSINQRAGVLLGAPAPTPTPAGTVGGFPTRIIKTGGRGPDVVAVKYGLNVLRPLTGRGHLPVNDTYDQLTASVVGSFQSFSLVMQVLAGAPKADLMAVDEIWGPRTAGAAAWWGAVSAAS